MKNVKPMVSVICTAYNHEKYIRQCLDGFVMQKTDFMFEVLVHDDASTDRTADIIREYELLYPDIIKPIYQKENQYSKGIRIVKNFILPLARGKYLAYCEGDDYWCDVNKLQKQVDFLESHLDYSACVHNTEVQNLFNGKNIVPYGDKNKDLELSDCIYSGSQSFQTSSVMTRKDIRLKAPFFTTMIKYVGDYPMHIYYALVGKIYYFSEVMSVYRYGTEGSWTKTKNSETDKRIRYESIIKMLYAANEYSKNQYNDIFIKAINRKKYNLNMLNLDFKSALKDKENFNKESHKVKIKCFLYAYIPFTRKIWRYFKKRFCINDR